MLGKGATQKVVVLGNFLFVEKRDGGNQPVINLKSLNKFIMISLPMFWS